MEFVELITQNADQINTITNTIIAFGTLASIIIIYFTLREMRNQRRATYQPEIAVKSLDKIFLQWTESRWEGIWASKPHEPKDLKFARNDSFINFFNVGLGVAKNIKISWEYDSNLIFEKIIELKENSPFNIEIKVIEKRIKYSAIFKETQKPAGGCLIDMKNESRIDYIIPIDISKNPTKIFFPEDYLFLASILFKLAYKKNEDPTQSVLNILIPPLRFNFEYEDIGRNKYQKSFIATIFAFIVVTDAEKKLVGLNLNLDCTEITKKKRLLPI